MIYMKWKVNNRPIYYFILYKRLSEINDYFRNAFDYINTN